MRQMTPDDREALIVCLLPQISELTDELAAMDDVTSANYIEKHQQLMGLTQQYKKLTGLFQILPPTRR